MKILLLGGSAQQVIAIKTAKELGYFTVLCDFLPDNPGQYVADKFYAVSTTDKEAVLNVALKEEVDGILAYASDPAAPTAAFVSEKMNLPTNPYRSVDILCNKDKFRNFLLMNGFSTPFARSYSFFETAIDEIYLYQFPIIIKPVDSSGSKGTTVLRKVDHIKEAIQFAFSFSRTHRIIIEEFIEKKHKYLVGGDIFVVNGKIILWGLLNCHRDNLVNPLVPAGKSYPPALDDKTMFLIQDILQKIIHKLSIQNGAVNVELVVDEKDNVWPIDIGPRNGGNMIPDLLEHIFHVDVVEMSINAAMGKKINNQIPKGIPYYATHNLHSSKRGKYKDILFKPDLEKFIFKKCLYKVSGDEVDYFDNASKSLGVIFMKFETEKEMLKILEKINKMYTVMLQ